MDRDILKEGGAFCVGIIATGFGIAGAGLGATISGIALLTVTSVWYSEHRAARKRVEAALEQFRRGFERDRDVDAAALAKLDARFRAALGQFTVERDELRGLLKGGNFEGAVAARFLKQWGVDKENLPSAHLDYLQGLIVAGLCAAMEDKKFRDAIMLQSVLAVLENQQGQIPRALFENIAVRFQHDNPDAPVPELEAFLKDKAKEWKALKARLAELEASNARVANVRAQAEAAIGRGEFEAARDLLDGVAEVQRDAAVEALRQVAEVHGLKADTFLLQGDADAAAESLEAGAALFSGVDRLEEARHRHAAAVRLQEHGQRYGGAGLQNAIQAYRHNLEVRTRAEHPVDWAMTQNNLAGALWSQAARVEGAAGADLLGDAVAAYRAALEVYTRAEHPVDWAMTQNNLAIALGDQAARVEGAAGADLLGDAVAAYRAALEVRTRAEHPVDWAATQNNLAGALWSQAARVEGAAGADLLGDAVAAYRAALEVRTRAEHPVDWAMTQENLGLAFEVMGDRAAEGRAERYGQALGCFDAALEVFDPVHMGPNHAKCLAQRERVQGKLKGLG